MRSAILASWICATDRGMPPRKISNQKALLEWIVVVAWLHRWRPPAVILFCFGSEVSCNGKEEHAQSAAKIKICQAEKHMRMVILCATHAIRVFLDRSIVRYVVM